MPSFVRWFCLTLFAVLTLGCAGASEITDAPTDLSDVNQVLEKNNATIVWVSGERISGARYVRVSADSVRYRLHTEPGGVRRWEHPPPIHPDEETTSRSIDEVECIIAHVGGGGGARGFAIGAVPGGVLAGVSFYHGVRENSGWALLGVLYYGAVGLLGGVAGAVVGEMFDEDKQIVYRHPVDRYLKP